MYGLVHGGEEKKVKQLWRCCIMALAWGIWLECNARSFEEQISDKLEMWSKIKSIDLLWAFSSNLFGSFVNFRYCK